jgi:putative transposase
MNKTFQYRLYPTKKQQTRLNGWLALCCETYNAALQERRDAYRLAGVSLGYAQQCAELPDCKAVRPELGEVNSQVLQDAVKRVDLAFAAFFRRCAAGEKPGYPRFRSRARYDSLTFKQCGNSFALSADGKLVLSKLGQVKMALHRPLRGTPKTAIVKRTPTGKWFVSICCRDVEPASLPASDEQVGIDVGLATFAYLSDGSHIENPRFFRQEEHALAKAQRKLSKATGETPDQRKRRKVVAASMSASAIAGRTSLASKSPCWSSGSGSSPSRPWWCAVWSRTPDLRNRSRMRRGRRFSPSWSGKRKKLPDRW